MPSPSPSLANNKTGLAPFRVMPLMKPRTSTTTTVEPTTSTTVGPSASTTVSTTVGPATSTTMGPTASTTVGPTTCMTAKPMTRVDKGPQLRKAIKDVIRRKVQKENKIEKSSMAHEATTLSAADVDIPASAGVPVTSISVVSVRAASIHATSICTASIHTASVRTSIPMGRIFPTFLVDSYQF
ncbi:mucin-5AC [Odontomachus brunneus]|uniref:mucin-5AC n=1 Tax=Odontomachus brunneus TaxID=486640 RepID=UPI0013F22654|nr:mucin-5AC [Odontomachus brunneus]